MASEDIVLNVSVNGKEQIENLSASLRSLVASNSELGRNIRGVDARQRALSKAFGVTSKGVGEHAKTLKEARLNQRVLGQESKRLQANLKALRRGIKDVNRQYGPKAAADVKNYARQLKTVRKELERTRPKALTNDLKSLSMQIKKAGKDAQFVGRSLIIGLTTPILAFANKGLDAFQAFDREMIRLKKIAGDVIPDYERFGDVMFDLSNKFGVSRDLIVGVTADFAELGISTESALTGLTDLTNQVAVLGTMDVSESQGLIQTMFLGTMRSMDLMGRQFESTAEKQEKALGSVTAQMYLFNAIENNTALAFRDMAIAIPEASAATIAFGLSMTQTAALLAPMKAAGIDVSTAANGLKVSLQRLVTPTGILQKEMDRLLSVYSESSGVLGDAFDDIVGTGMASIQGLINATKELRDVADDETVLQFYSKLFQKRQATRMLTAIDSLVSFQDQLFESTDKGSAGVRAFVAELNSATKAATAMQGAMLPAINNVESFTLIARVGNAQVGDEITGITGAVTQAQIDAANAARQHMREYISDVERDSEDGIQLIDQISSQAGKALFVELLGAESAAALAQEELDIALNSASKALDRARIGFKNIAVEIISAAEPAIRKFSSVMIDLADKFKNMSNINKQLIIGIGAFVASIGPLVFIMGQMKLAVGVVSGVLLKFVPQVARVGSEALIAAPKMLNLRRAVTLQGDAYVTSAGKFSRYIATLASGNGIVASVANRFGLMTGILKKGVTAPADVLESLGPETASGARALKKIITDAFEEGAKDMVTGGTSTKEVVEQAGKNVKEDLIQGGVAAGKALEASSQKASLVMAAAHKGNFVTPMHPQGARSTGRLALPAAGESVASQRERFISTGKRGTPSHRILGTTAMGGAIAMESSYKRRFDQAKAGLTGPKEMLALPAAGQTSGPAFVPPARKSRFSRVGSGAGKAVRGIDAGMGAIASAPKKAFVIIKNNLTEAFKFIKRWSKMLGPVLQAPFVMFAGVVGKLTKLPIIGKLLTPFIGILKIFTKLTVLKPFGFLFKSFGSFGKLFKIIKLGFGIFTGGVLIGALVALGPYIKAIIDNFSLFKEKIEPAIGSIQYAFASLKGILAAIISPFKDLFHFIGGTSSSAEKVDQVASVFNKVARFVAIASRHVKDFVEKYIVPFLRKAMGAVLTLVNGFKGIVKAAIDMKNGVAGAGDRMKEALKKVGRGIVEFFMGTIAPALVNVFASLVKVAFKLLLKLVEYAPTVLGHLVALFVEFLPTALKIFRFLVVGIAKLFANLPGFVGKVLNKITTMFTDWVKDKVEDLGIIGSIIGFTMSGLDKLGDGIQFVGETITDGLLFAVDALDIGLGHLIGLISTVDGSIFREFGSDLSAMIGEKLKDAPEQFDKFVDDIKDVVMDKLKDFEPTPIAHRMGDSITEEVAETIDPDEMFEPTIETSNNAGEEAGENFADKFAGALKDLRQKFVDLVGDFLKSEISDVASELTDALESQRDAALKVFEDQIETIDKLGKAEESLMKQKEFIANRQRILDERELNRQNYVRNRALAIYEGRIDDARMLDLEEQKSSRESAQSLEEINAERNKELRKENLEFLKDQIKETRKEADDFFKEQIKAFKDASKEITKFAPQTINDYEEQLNELKKEATKFSDENAKEFEKTFSKMRDKIRTGMPNKVVGVFEDNLDDLVDEAKKKYGLDENPDSVVGATISMLTMVGDKIGSNTTINTNWVSILDGIKGEILDVGAGSIVDVIANHGPQAVLAEAIMFAEETILHGWRGTVDHILSEVDGLADMMDPMIASILESQLAYEALRDAASAAADAQRDAAVAGGGTATGVDGGSTPVQIKTPAQVAEEAARLYAIEAAKTPSIAGYLTKPKVERLERATFSHLGTGSLGYTTNRRAQVAIPQQTIRTSSQNMIQNAIANSLSARGMYQPIGRAYGGYVPGFKSSGIPAMLHGGEYVLNAKAVQNMGRAALDVMNNTRFSTPGGMSGQGAVTTVNKTENINIYVDNFIGEERWFETMMDSYNVKVKPIKEKSRGEEVRVFNSYNYRTGR